MEPEDFDEGVFTLALNTFQDRDEIKLVTRLEDARYGADESEKGGLSVIGVVLAAEIVDEHRLCAGNPVPFDGRDDFLDRVKRPLVGGHVDRAA
ncbi:hypothetical protein D3C71_1807910 [compost metagenome]